MSIAFIRGATQLCLHHGCRPPLHSDEQSEQLLASSSGRTKQTSASSDISVSLLAPHCPHSPPLHQLVNCAHRSGSESEPCEAANKLRKGSGPLWLLSLLLRIKLIACFTAQLVQRCMSMLSDSSTSDHHPVLPDLTTAPGQAPH